MIPQCSKRARFFLTCGFVVVVVVIGMSTLRPNVSRVSMEVLALPASSDGAVSLLFTNPGPNEVLCSPQDLVGPDGAVSAILPPDRAEVFVLKAGNSTRYVFQLPEGVKGATRWQFHYRCHERATGLAALVERKANQGFPWWLLYRLVDQGLHFVDGAKEIPFNGRKYDITSPMIPKGGQRPNPPNRADQSR